MGILVAALGGFAIGLERQWSGHATGPRAHFGGLRTFTLLGGTAGIAGWLAASDHALLGAFTLAGPIALIIAAYVAASRRDVDGTTEVAALVVIGAGTLAGLGALRLASGVVATTSLLLVEKSRLHRLTGYLEDTELRASALFAVMAVVVLPALPEGPYGPLGGVHPRELWILVLFFSGLSFAGYVTRRTVGAGRGYLIAGLLGGIVSSTSVTLTFSSTSQREQTFGAPLAFGVVAACSIMFARTLIAASVLQPSLVAPLAPLLAAPFVVGLLALIVGFIGSRDRGRPIATPSNPLELGTAVRMVIIFQLVLFLVHLARERFGDSGLLVSGALIGLTDVDAVTLSMAKSVALGTTPITAAKAIAMGSLSNTLLKLVLVLSLGRGSFRQLAALALTSIAVVLGAAIYFLDALIT